jgi:hypothetical protein
MLNYINYVNNYTSGSSSFGGGTYAEGRRCTGTSEHYWSVGEIGKTIRILDTNVRVSSRGRNGETYWLYGAYRTTIKYYFGWYPDGYLGTRYTTRRSYRTTNQCQYNGAEVAGAELNAPNTDLEPATGLGSEGEAVG